MTTATRTVDATTYSRILDFYARHVQTLDAGDAKQWAADFTEDGVFGQNVKPHPKVGRVDIEVGMQKGMDALAARGISRRHWFGMVTADPVDAHTVRTRYYATVFETTPDGEARVYLNTTAEDTLHVTDTSILVSRRLVTHDNT
ncbi:nuclear transport factor 2 family protein [Rhodococcoides kyotonense]|uniref:SnoaL-like domain-containing protein n=1 Tax=Rhodococcoides kyotonense TaxID=398843 RepID=A0A239MCU0_9NOCA|nr:nuclear transport factor 2 family protein [Rhodococcus kyotonensis]SNT39798.1 SnoaL-like domain-containing protein [Rhodococcus kyotonensis]